MPTQYSYFALGGGLDLKTPTVAMKPGRLLQAQNVEQKISGGYRRIKGFEKFDATAVPGEGPILGAWYYNTKLYAFRNAVGSATAEMYESTGAGWTLKKAGLAPDGNYEFCNYNFDGTFKMYGVSGTHKAFEWDGTTWTDLTTGMAPDTPNHVIGHKKHLFLSFGASVQFSALGDPTSWTPVTGAGELLIDDGVSGFMQLSGGVLGIFGRNSTNILSGSSATDFVNENLSEHGNRIGAIPGTLQQMGSRVKFLDDRGVTDLGTSQRFGDFEDAATTYEVNDYLLARKDEVQTSCIIKEKSQYRIFFNDGSGMIFTFAGDKMIGATLFLYPVVVRCITSAEDLSGEEVIFFGGDTGYVYRMESGTSFDGDAIVAYMRTAYNHVGNPRQRKRFRRAVFDLESDGEITISVKPDFRHEDAEFNKTITYKNLLVRNSGGTLGKDMLGTFVLGASYIAEGQIDMAGHGSYVSLFIYSNEIGPSWEIDGITYDYLPGRGRR